MERPTHRGRGRRTPGARRRSSGRGRRTCRICAGLRFFRSACKCTVTKRRRSRTRRRTPPAAARSNSSGLGPSRTACPCTCAFAPCRAHTCAFEGPCARAPSVSSFCGFEQSITSARRGASRSRGVPTLGRSRGRVVDRSPAGRQKERRSIDSKDVDAGSRFWNSVIDLAAFLPASDVGLLRLCLRS